GNYVEGYMIENITDKKGNIIYEHETKSEPVFTPQTAYLTIDMMRSVVESGTAAGILNELNFSPDLAGKTGTTNDFIDVWFIASTPQVTLSSWIGYDNDGDERRQLQYYDNGADFDASGANESYWAELANAIYSVNPTIMGADKSFVRPNGIVSSTVLAQTGMKPGKMTLPDGKTLDVTGPTTTDLFNSNFLPGTTVFNFAVGATPSELNTFWFDTYLKAREEEEKKKIEDAKDKEQKKKEEENKKKSEEDKASEEK
ncbi:MAG: penicillin-binding transpeptidase domain-containing protein, partial [Carnobacterium sp.]